MNHGMKKCPFVWLLTALLLCAQPRSADAQADDPLVVVASKSNGAAQQLTKSDVKKILLGDMTSWPGGSKVSVVLLKPGDPDRNLILHTFCGMTEIVFTKTRMQTQFTGGTTAEIQAVAGVSQVRVALMMIPGAIGIVHKSDVDPTEKVILTVQ